MAHRVVIEDETNVQGIDVSRWECECGGRGRWTPSVRRWSVVERGEKHAEKANAQDFPRHPLHKLGGLSIG